MEFYFTVKKSNGGTVRKHTIRKLNGDTKVAEVNKKLMTNGSDINQNNALANSASAAQDTSNLSDSTIQAFRETLHYRPLSQTSQSSPIHDTVISSAQTDNNGNDQMARTEDERPEANVAAAATATAVAESDAIIHSNCVGRTDHELDNRALFQGISLKDFEKHHKLMKEANTEKRRLLSSAIEQR